MAAFYAARDHRPLWVKDRRLRSEARQVLELVRSAEADGLSPTRHAPEPLETLIEAADRGDPAALAQAEAALSQALAAYVLDLKRPRPAAAIVYTDPALRPAPLSARGVLETAARARSLGRHLPEIRRMNPLYEGLRESLALYRSRWTSLPQIQLAAGPPLRTGSHGPRVRALRTRLGLAPAAGYDAPLAEAVRRFQADHGLAPTGVTDTATLAALNAGPQHYERLILANLERARALPADLGRRFVLVDAAAAMLWLYEDGQVRDSMRVVVGKTAQPTPAMAGLIRYAVFNPYWNIPEDLVRDTWAPKVLAAGPAVLQAEGMEVLSDWSDQASVLDPATIDWAAVASGQRPLRMRQRPGPHNMMGQVKLMLPNDLGIYLHDTPNRTAFLSPTRAFSAGCVRLERAMDLAGLLLGSAAEAPDSSGGERRVDLPEPVPVYIAYFTAAPAPEGIAFRPDVYGRDPALIAQLEPQPSAARRLAQR